jgi:hypothetical protein
MIAININVTKIDNSALYAGKNGKYLALTLHENKQGRDQYGNDGFVAQDLGKERRMAGEKGVILGNYKTIGGLVEPTRHEAAKANAYQPQPVEMPDGDEIPF